MRNGKLSPLNATGLPVGLFCQSEYDVIKLNMQSGDSLFLFTDGLTEASVNEVEYGEDRVKAQLLKSSGSSSKIIIDELISDHQKYLNGPPKFDDVTIAALSRI